MKYISLIVIMLVFTAGSCAEVVVEKPIVNPAHLNHLYEEVIVDQDTMGIVHIYAEYPDYQWYDDSDEGAACIDDGARAMSFYLEYYKYSGDYSALVKARHLLNYIFYMQAESGWFYNFTWKDNSINKKFRTSVAEPNWWSWRAFRALVEAGEYFNGKDEALYNRIKQSERKLLKILLPWLEKEKKYKDFSGFNLPVWLPYETASDQASILLESLSIYFRSEKDSTVIPHIKNLADGIIQMQAGSNVQFPYNAFLSWQNTWHAWGNAQADALLLAGKATGDTSYINSALKEVKHFYNYLQKNRYLSSFVLEKNGTAIDTVEVHMYSQIAYGMRPMITAALAAYDITKDTAYAILAGRLACWFFGDNPNTEAMYDPETGRGYDGIVDERKINKNSGAESTIESLTSLLAVEKNSIAKRICKEYYEKRK